MQALLIRLEDHEREALDDVARRHKLSRAAVLRQTLQMLAGAPAPHDPILLENIRELRSAFERAGVNLNQVARRLNSSDALDARTLGAVLTEIIQLNRDTRALLAALEEPRQRRRDIVPQATERAQT
ncbi:MAG: hypothetical protein ACRCTI_03925 [Beijerinckiaceae bacterium]